MLNQEEQRVYFLDLIRGIAAFAVAIPHFLSIEYAQSIGLEIISILSVEIFFTLSGFVLAPQIIHCLATKSIINLRIFLVRRWMRTVPPFLLALIAMTLLTSQSFGADFLRYSIYSSNLWAQLNTIDYFQTAWSLSVEEWFYIAFPILGMVATYTFRAESFRFMITFSVLFILLTFLIRSIFGSLDDWGESVRRITIFRIDAIAFGFLLFLLSNTIKIKFNNLIILITFLVFCFISYETAYYIAVINANWAKNIFPFTSAVLGCSLVLLTSQLDPLIRKSTIMIMVANFFGKVSYSIYLFQIVVAILVYNYCKFEQLETRLIVYVASLLLLSTVIYYWFERPILRARPKWTQSIIYSVRAY
jgi:peptidoglycan/LPS O-acetylase OafA/YrhL